MLDMSLFMFIFLVAFTIGLTSAAEAHWGYPNLEKEEEFPKWGGLCDMGGNQSPINLNPREALKGQFGKLEFENYDNKQTGVVVINNGHTIQLSQFPKEMELQGGPLLEEYVVEQIHLHWWSEHTIANYRYPLEVHIVHRNKLYPNMTMAANFKDGITVVAVLYVVSNQRNAAIDKIAEVLDELKSYEAINKPVTMKDPFVVKDLVPKVNGYFTYAGSLTTPSCAESVTWIVVHEEFPVKLEQLEKFREIEYEEGKQLRNNYRSIQKTNNRPVIVVLPDNDETKYDGAGVSLHVLPLTTVLIVASLGKFLQ